MTTFDVAKARAHHQELQKLIGTERETVATFLLRLMEFERDKMHERLGFASMWDFCRRGLGLCESTTGRRLKATRIIERFPVAVEYLRDGRLCTTRMLLLRDVLTPENATDLFEQAARKSMEEIELLVATAKPHPAPPVRIQKLPEPRHAGVAAPALVFGSASAPIPAPEASAAASLVCTASEPSPVPAPPARRAELHPTSAQEYVVRLPASRAWVQKLEMAKKLGSHVVPTRDPVAILELALDLFIEKHGKRRGAIAVRSTRAPAAPREPEAIAAVEPTVESPVSASAPPAPMPSALPATRHPAKRERFTAEDLRFIWSRDEGRCTWLMDSGERCGSEYQLEVDHIEAVAKGGATDPRCARLLCRAHNDQHARETFGEAFMKSKKPRRAPC